MTSPINPKSFFDGGVSGSFFSRERVCTYCKLELRLKRPFQWRADNGNENVFFFFFFFLFN